jgi:glycosyltransferase involved in cell wall biosynthesis
MTLDIIIATFNRESLLRKTLESLLTAPVPAGMEARVVVVDNNSKDGTKGAVEAFLPRFGGRLKYLFEPTPGKSAALNTGLANSDGELVGLIDDDEEVNPDWFSVIAAWMSDQNLDFIGGSCKPKWEIPAPAWVPMQMTGLIGKIDEIHTPTPYGKDFPGILMGGNAVIRRTVLNRTGPWNVKLGPSESQRLLSSEDEDMYERLLDCGARGMYVPELTIHHWVPASRLTKRYYRKWCLWHGVSQGAKSLHRPEQVTHLFGVPRYHFGRALRGSYTNLAALLSRREPASATFFNELLWWELCGFVWGRHFHRRG